MKRSEILSRIGITPPPASRVRLIVDTDAKNEADDQYAILHHLLTPMFDVRGIVAAHFEQKAGHTCDSMEKSLQEIRKVLSLAEIDDVPFFRGCVSPLKSPHDAPDSEGVRFIIEEARKPGKLYIALQGAATDVAAAINAAPDIAGNLVLLWNGGGPYPEGRPEFNVMQDPHAVRVMLESPAEVWQTDQSVYCTLEVTLAELKSRVYPCGKIGRYLYEQLEAENHVEYNPDFLLRTGENWVLGDNTTAAVLLMNRFRGNFHMEHAPVIAEDLTYRPNPDGKMIRVYDSIDVRMTLEDLYAKLRLAYGSN